MKSNIIIIEDSALNRDILNDLLKDNYNLIECENGEEGLEKIKSTDDVACVLLDLILPGISGIDVLKALTPEECDTKPVIVISGSSNLEEQRLAFKYGAFDYILKPFDLKNVLHRINNTIFAKNRLLELHKELATVKNDANYDGLTGVYTRKKSEELIREYIENNDENVGLLVFDLDNFKLINDLQGHQVGDLTLIKVAKLISSYFRPYDIVGRLGGDEFFVLMTRLKSKSDLETKALDIVRLLHFNPNITIPANVSVSVGGAYKEENDLLNFDDLYGRADKALYKAKENGKNCFVLFGNEDSSASSNKEKVLMITRNRSLSETVSLVSRELNICFKMLDYGTTESIEPSNNLILLDISEELDYSSILKRVGCVKNDTNLIVCVPETNIKKMSEAFLLKPASIITLPTSIDTVTRNIKRILNSLENNEVEKQ